MLVHARDDACLLVVAREPAVSAQVDLAVGVPAFELARRRELAKLGAYEVGHVLQMTQRCRGAEHRLELRRALPEAQVDG